MKAGVVGLGALPCWLLRGCLAAWTVWMVLAGGLVCTGEAFAATGHAFVASVTEGPAGTALVAPSAVAVDRGTGRVFVSDPVTGYVSVYSAANELVAHVGGGLMDAVGVAVDEASGDLYVADAYAEGIDVYAPDGQGGYEPLARWWGAATPTGEFGEVTGVAVDNSHGPSSGDVYVLEGRVADGESGVVDAFRPAPNPPKGEEGEEGTFVGRLAGGKLDRPNGITVDQGSGRVFVADSVNGALWIYGPERSYEEKLNGKGSPHGSFKSNGELGNVAGVGVDEATGDVYVSEAERHAVSQYAYESGEWRWQGWIATTPEGDLAEPRGVAVPPSGDVIVADANSGRVDRFGPAIVVPSVETVKTAKSGLTRTSAILSGTINAEEKVAIYHFQYGKTDALGFETVSEPVSVSSGTQTVTASADKLEAGRTYYYRIVGSDGDGSNYGLTRSFETSPAVDALSSDPATSITPQSATLTGSLKREGLETIYYFQYGETIAYGQQAPGPPSIVPPAAEEKEEKQLKTVDARVAGLTADTLYHYRVVAKNQYGTTYGEDGTFATLGPPLLTIGPPTGIGQTKATLNGQINPEQTETTYRVRYGPTAGYGQETRLASVTPSTTPQPIAVSLSSLQVGTTYHYRVIAENTNGTTTSPDETFATIPSAPVDATYATEINSSAATLHAVVNPLGSDTHVYFEYGRQPCHTGPEVCSRVPLEPGTDVGMGSVDTSTQASVAELHPDTTYYFRTMAVNRIGTTRGPEHTFTTQAQLTTFGLPDHRTWEMVTPVDKGSAPVEALTREGGIILAAESGDVLTYLADGALGARIEGNRSPEMQQIFATRTPNGWVSQDIATPNSVAKGISPGSPPEYQFFASDLAVALVEPPEPGPAPPLAPGVTQGTMYVRNNQTGTYLPVVTEANTAPGTQFGGRAHFVSATADLKHVVVSAAVALTARDSAHGLYEWSDGKLQFVSALPSGKPAATPELGYDGSVLTNAVSNDGSRLIWTNKEDFGTRGGHLYLRDTVRGATVKLDAAQGVPEPEKGSAQFQGASADGSRVFFIDRQRLTPDATAEPGQGSGQPDLYECQIVETNGKLGCELRDLTVVDGQGEHANVRGLVLGISEDGSRVFLIARGVLATNVNGNGERAVSGRDNLYEIHNIGMQSARTYVATLSEEDSPEWSGGTTGANTAYVTARVSPNGRYFAFMANASITGYDNVDANPVAKGARDEEVYLYDSKVGSLRCVSCNPSGARPNGVHDQEHAGEGFGLLVDRRLVWGREGREHWLAGNIPGWTAQSLPTPGEPGALFQSRYLSNDGRLYFNSPDALVPAATNGKENVYEYEPSKTGGCQSATGGCIALLSAGSSVHESAFLEATPDGSNVFFLTEARLLPQQDTDTAFDIYDARECSETAPCLAPPSAKEEPCGATETCRPAQPAEPIPGGPAGTASFSGPGNIITRPPAPSKHGVEARKTSKPISRAQRLKHALKVCRKHHARSKKKRKVCEQRARRRYARKHKHGRKHKAKAGTPHMRARRSAR